MLLSVETEAKSELLRRWDEYLLASAEPRYVREMTKQALNWERRMIAKDYAERVLTLQDVRELAGDEAKAQVAFSRPTAGRGGNAACDRHTNFS